MISKMRGFTLIELLIVVAIIGILAAIAVPNFLNAQVRARIARARADLQAIDTALSSYQIDHNKFPPMYFPAAYNSRYNAVPTMLTTPVAYIASAQIQDVFRQGIAGYMSVQQGLTGMSYGYNNIRNMVNTGVSGFDERDIRAYGEWRLFSAGPDKGIQPYETYEGSNGLTSCGDILRTQRSTAGFKLNTTSRPVCIPGPPD